jgi:hypothetical protein
MAFALKGAGGTVTSTTANQSTLVLTTATTAGAVGDFAVLRYAVDNNQTTDGDEVAVTGITDSAGNQWSKGAEFTNGQGGAQSGTTCGVWSCNLSAALAIGSTITLTFSNNTSRDASAAALEYFTKASGTYGVREGTPGTLAADGAAAGSLDVTTANIACLRIRAVASESSTATALTKTAAFTAVLSQAVTASGATATNQGIRGEYLISTGTGQASNPTAGAGSVDHASVYVAFKEIAQQVLGWQQTVTNRKAAVRVWPALLLATQATQFAAPAPSTETPSQFGWHQQLSKAVPVAKAKQGEFSVPFNTPQVAPPSATVEGWQSQPSVAPAVARAVPTQATGFQSPAAADNNTTAKAWHQPLSTSAPVPKARQGDFEVPFNTPQVSASPHGWRTPLGRPVPVARARQGEFFVPFNTAQTNTATIDKWRQPLSVAVPVAKAKPGLAFVPFNTPQINTQTVDKWLQPLSRAVPVAKAAATQPSGPFTPTAIPRGWQEIASAAPRRAVINNASGLTFVAQPFTVDNNTTAKAWHQPLSGAPRPPSAVQSQATQFQTPEQATNNNVDAKAWQQPLSGAPRPPFAVQSQATQFQTPEQAADNNTTSKGWFQPLSVAVKVAKAKQGDFFVPLNTPQIVLPVALVSDAGVVAERVVYYQANIFPPAYIAPVDNNTTAKAWHQPLSVAVPVARAKQGVSFVPFNTAQVTPSRNLEWLQPFSVAARVAKAAKTQPTFTVPPVGAPAFGWHQPLGSAVKVAKAVHTQPLWINVQFAVPQGWFQPLSVAVKLAQPQQQSVIHAPYAPPPAAPVAIEGMAWFRPLDAAAPKVNYPWQVASVTWLADELSTVDPPDTRTRRPLYLRGVSYWKGVS